MHLKFRNVNDAFRGLVSGIATKDIPTIAVPSRNGPVLMIPEPVILTYSHPRERVLFNSERDASPFFHLFEALWMLAGRNDVAPLAYYAKQINEYSDNGETLNGAYGMRWRHAMFSGCAIEGHDQLKLIIDHLKRKPESRRVVLSMWDVEDDLLKIDCSKDVCCNLSVMFSIRDEIGETKTEDTYVLPAKYLDMTVTNRSNDLIWGCLGANYVHFSFLQEYMACALGVEVGVYNQFTNNLHVYTESNSGFKPDLWLNSPGEWNYGGDVGCITGPRLFEGGDFQSFDDEVKEFVERNGAGTYLSEFLRDVAQSMCLVFQAHKARNYATAEYWIEEIKAQDWRIASSNWIQKRKRAYMEKNT